MVAAWVEAGVPVWGSVPERVNIASGPEGWLSPDGLESYREIWRRGLHVRSVAVRFGSRSVTRCVPKRVPVVQAPQ